MKQLPTDFINQTQSLLGQEEAAALFYALTSTVPPVSVRLNPLKKPDALPAAVRGEVAWCGQGRYLQERPLFTADPLLHSGCYYVQEASSMFVEQAYRRISQEMQPHRVLDLCAAPGGKSTLWRSLLPDGALLVANEPVRQRAQVLAENLTKWGHPDTVVTQARPQDFSSLGSFFDVVATDVPCSGEGMFRKDDVAVAEWSAEAVEACAARQWEIISSVWPALREGGFLVYSTCTFNRSENEDMVWRICHELGAETVPLYILKEWGVAGDTTGRSLHVCHFFPHLTEGEGFFIALLRKTSDAPCLKEKKMRKSSARAAAQGSNAVSGWLSRASDFKLLSPDEEHIIAVREGLSADILRLTTTVRTLTAGILLSQAKGRKLIPQHALAMSAWLSPTAFPRQEISRQQAHSYLRRESIALPDGTPRGHVVLTFHGHPLGFANNLGTRANNLYPPEWRIRTQGLE